MSDGEKRNPLVLHALDARVGVKDDVEDEMAALVGSKSHHNAPEEATHCSSSIHRSWLALLSS